MYPTMGRGAGTALSLAWLMYLCEVAVGLLPRMALQQGRWADSVPLRARRSSVGCIHMASGDTPRKKVGARALRRSSSLTLLPELIG